MKTEIAAALLIAALTAQSSEIIPNITTADGRRFTNAEIVRVDAQYVVINCSDQLSRIAMTNLPPDLQTHFHFNPAKAAAEAAKIKQQKDAAVQAQASALKSQQMFEMDRLYRVVDGKFVPIASGIKADGEVLAVMKDGILCGPRSRATARPFLTENQAIGAYVPGGDGVASEVYVPKKGAIFIRCPHIGQTTGQIFMGLVFKAGTTNVAFNGMEIAVEKYDTGTSYLTKSDEILPAWLNDPRMKRHSKLHQHQP